MAKASLVLLVASLITALLSGGAHAPSFSPLERASIDLFEEDEGEDIFASEHLFEIDSPATFIGQNRANMLFDDADWQETSSDFRLNMGKKWDVISPVRPGTADAGSGYYSGTVGLRRTLFRAARSVAFSDAVLITLQGSLDPNLIADVPTDRVARGELSDWPQILGRLDLTLGIAATTVNPPSWVFQATSAFEFVEGSPPPLSVPPEGEARFEAWSVNVDLRFPVSESFGVQGQLFTGINSRLQGPIHSTGSWCEIWYDWTPRWHSRVGVGINDRVDHDSLSGDTHQHFIFANLSFDVTDHLATGVEVAYRESSHQESRIGEILTDQLARSEPSRVVVIDWMLKCSF